MITNIYDVTITSSLQGLDLKKFNLLGKIRRFSGFGASETITKEITDVNNNGIADVRIRCPRGVEAIVRDASGNVLASVDASSERQDFSLNHSGELSVTFREV